MPEYISFVSHAVVPAYTGLLLVAAAIDLGTRRIPVWLIVALTAAFIPSALHAGLGFDRIGIHLLTGLAVYGFGLILVAVALLGGGDVRLIAAIAVWTGYHHLVNFVVATMIAGFFLALIVALIVHVDKRRNLNGFLARRVITENREIAYGPAIAAGGIMSCPEVVFSSLVSF